ncbi:MAG: radical SAM protein, partial [Clostridia bacterium]|nr:radical SAM protein [Clostridia bacterium]
MAHLEITTTCNHRCIHCYKLDSELANRPIEIVDEETIYNNAVKLINNRILQIVITGGEPLLKPRLLKRIIKLANEFNVTVSVNTNLTLASYDIINFLKQTNTRILTSCPSGVEASFDKLTLTKNFKVFEENLRLCNKVGVKTSVNMVVTKDNISEIIPTAKKIKELGCTSFCTTPVALNMDYPRPDLLLSIEDIHKLIADILWIETNLGMKVDILDGLPKCILPSDILKEEHLFLYRRCQAGRTFVAVSPDGSVRPCANTSYSYGNINQENLSTIWERMSYWRSDKIIPKECNGCLWINRCLGGCRSN